VWLHVARELVLSGTDALLQQRQAVKHLWTAYYVVALVEVAGRAHCTEVKPRTFRRYHVDGAPLHQVFTGAGEHTKGVKDGPCVWMRG
jgi:hypothetical protein